MKEICDFLEFIGQGIGITLLLLIGSLFVGLFLGSVIALSRYYGKCIWIITRYISILRGTPMMLQLSLVYFVLPSLLPVNLDVLTAGIIAFGLNSSAYVAEIFRAGIESVPKGQFLAAKSLRIPNFYVWKDIILPQIIKNIGPALVNEAVTLAKDTAMISILGGMDIMRRAQVLSSEHFTYFLPLCIAALYYYLLVYVIEIGAKYFGIGGESYLAH